MFLRGLNVMDPKSTTQVDPNKADEFSRNVGDYEADEVGPHSHGLNAHYSNYPGGDDNHGSHVGMDGSDTHHAEPTDSNGTRETRPKNIAVYYYIKVN
jgi:hypothetical protein